MINLRTRDGFFSNFCRKWDEGKRPRVYTARTRVFIYLFKIIYFRHPEFERKVVKNMFIWAKTCITLFTVVSAHAQEGV